MFRSLLLLTLIAVSTFAYSHNLIVFSEDGNPFYLILNGVRQNEEAQTNVFVSDLNSPFYSTKIIFEDANMLVIEKKVLSLVGVDGVVKWKPLIKQSPIKKES